MTFEGQVILVTGSARGLGNAFARYLAAHDATVVLNSTGANRFGEQTAAEIREAGGRAEHIAGDVNDAQALVDAVLERCGSLWGIVHNAGFVRDKTLRKMTDEQWQAVLDVHLRSAFRLSRAAWPHFEQQGGGRLTFISSASGLYGNFGQSNYAAAKAGMHGLCKSIALEGAQGGIQCNCVAPYGATELNSANLDEARKALIKPVFIAPLVAYLSHPDCQESGEIFEASAGAIKKVRLQRSQGYRMDTSGDLALAELAANWDKVNDFSQVEYPADMRASLSSMVSGSS